MSANNVSIADMRVTRQGVVTLTGYGITVRVDRGHLLVDDGIGAANAAKRCCPELDIA